MDDGAPHQSAPASAAVDRWHTYCCRYGNGRGSEISRSLMESNNNPVDPTRLTDADWAALNKLRDAYQQGGRRR